MAFRNSSTQIWQLPLAAPSYRGFIRAAQDADIGVVPKKAVAAQHAVTQQRDLYVKARVARIWPSGAKKPGSEISGPEHVFLGLARTGGGFGFFRPGEPPRVARGPFFSFRAVNKKIWHLKVRSNQPSCGTLLAHDLYEGGFCGSSEAEESPLPENSHAQGDGCVRQGEREEEKEAPQPEETSWLGTKSPRCAPAYTTTAVTETSLMCLGGRRTLDPTTFLSCSLTTGQMELSQRGWRKGNERLASAGGPSLPTSKP